MLTGKGRLESFRTGFSRGDYLILDLNLLNADYTARELFIISTDTNRTYETALAFFRGLYPFEDDWLSKNKQMTPYNNPIFDSAWYPLTE